MLTKRQTVGIRVPDNAISLAIVQEFGHPIISTSATDPETNVSLETPQEIKRALGHAVDLIVDGGSVLGRPSSVISLIDDTPEVLRVGSGDVSVFQQ